MCGFCGGRRRRGGGRFRMRAGKGGGRGWPRDERCVVLKQSEDIIRRIGRLPECRKPTCESRSAETSVIAKKIHGKSRTFYRLLPSGCTRCLFGYVVAPKLYSEIESPPPPPNVPPTFEFSRGRLDSTSKAEDRVVLGALRWMLLTFSCFFPPSFFPSLFREIMLFLEMDEYRLTKLYSCTSRGMN